MLHDDRSTSDAPDACACSRFDATAKAHAPALPVEELFAQHALRCTRQRRQVYESLRACRSHPTVEELFNLVQSKVDRVSLATVYNALEALCRVGLVRRMPTTSGCCRFDADTSPHMHLRYRDSAEIVDVPDDLDLGAQIMSMMPEDTLREIEARFGVRVDGISLQLLVSSATNVEPPASGVTEA